MRSLVCVGSSNGIDLGAASHRLNTLLRLLWKRLEEGHPSEHLTAPSVLCCRPESAMLLISDSTTQHFIKFTFLDKTLLGVGVRCAIRSAEYWHQ